MPMAFRRSRSPRPLRTPPRAQSLSRCNPLRETCSGYGGLAPSDGDHLYELHAYALDALPDLENGFNYNVLYRKMDGHILDEFTLKALYLFEED
jgi:phosphatidylethanolamine-binding protein (PEBP) family uncharacterized protein